MHRLTANTVETYFRTAASSRLDRTMRSQANAALRKAGFDGNGRFRSNSLALSKAWAVLEKWGIQPGEVTSAHTFKRPKGHTTIRLEFINPEDSFSPVDLSNSVLAWHWMEQDNPIHDNVEVVAYLS